ncbi:hypothetical protein L484_001942 [Morus notabilis]|uniref:Uncharacterized protein n=1 Tax=Morus notabilis TaxID=981085 RepID=W9R5X2_9ROSA|nr:hypothetical protein L484_001942 [Morus notabilis]
MVRFLVFSHKVWGPNHLMGTYMIKVIVFCFSKMVGFDVIARRMETPKDEKQGRFNTPEVLDYSCLSTCTNTLLAFIFIHDAANFALLLPLLKEWYQKSTGLEHRSDKVVIALSYRLVAFNFLFMVFGRGGLEVVAESTWPTFTFLVMAPRRGGVAVVE